MSAFDVDIPDSSFDGPAETVDTPPASVDVSPEPQAAVGAPAEPASPEAVDLGGDSEPDVFDRAYVERLRQESAGYRTKAKEVAAVFEGIDPADADVFKSLMSMYKDDPAAAAREMARLAQGLLGDDEADTPAADADPQYMTRADYDRIREQERVESQARAIRAEAEGMGYPAGSAEYQYLLAVAKSNGGDLKAAHAYIEGRQQAAVDAYVAKKAAEADGAPTVGGGPAVPAGSERQFKTWRDVERAIDEMW